MRTDRRELRLEVLLGAGRGPPHAELQRHHAVQRRPDGGRGLVHVGGPEDALVDRITGRFSCAKCGAGYHDRYKLPKTPDTCDVCGNHKFKRRPDDNEETVPTRMAEYRAKTAPILPIYEARGLVTRVDGMADMESVGRAIAAVLNGKG